MTAVPPRPAAPDVSTDMGALREAIAQMLPDFMLQPRGSTWYQEVTDALLALPALRDLIAERDQAVAAVARVRELATEYAATELPPDYGDVIAADLRRALDDQWPTIAASVAWKESP